MEINITKDYIADILIVGDEAVIRNAIDRCIENHDETGESVPYGMGIRGWRDTFYNLETEEDVLDMWAWNAVSNNVTDVANLDGWADLPSGSITFYADLTEV